MADGYSRVRIFSPFGQPLTEIDVATKRGWVLDEPGRCQFSVPIYDPLTGGVSTKATGFNFAYGNLVLIEHKPSINQDGTKNGLLPPWVGIIDTPRTWKYGQINITAYGAEQILSKRASATSLTVKGSPGAQFLQLIQIASDTAYNPGCFPIYPGVIDMSGPAAEQVMKASILEEVRTLYKSTGYDWNISYSLDANNHLSLFANWLPRFGIPTGRVFSNVNMQASDPLYTEQGSIFNVIRSLSEATSTGNRVFALVADFPSIAANGCMALTQVWPGTKGEFSPAGISVVQQKGQAFIDANKNPTRTFAPSIIDSGNDFSYLTLGNTWLVQTDIVGFLANGQIGTNGLARITAMEYDDLKNTVLVAAVMQ